VRNLQTANCALLVRPASFGFNALTADSNALQTAGDTDPVSIASQARVEFAGLVMLLQSEGVTTCVVDDSAPPLRPDAVFPNNWISLHADGTVVLYPMLAPNRRLERRTDLIAQLCRETGFKESRRIDLSHRETAGQFLEGTGSLVLDHVQRIAYACRSPRTHEALVREWARLMQYEVCVFSASDEHGKAYYHTNVMMWIGSRCAAVCNESINAAERPTVLESLRRGGREIVELSRAAVRNFAGNMLELASWDEALGDCSVLLTSQTARESLSPLQWQRLTASVDTVLCVPVPTIEKIGGGSVRCMVAEVPT
jgi:hypothetical protein